MDKGAVRREIIEKLKNMTYEEKTHSNDIIFEKLLKLPEFLTSKVIFLYISVGDEADTVRLFNLALEMGKRVCIPKCEGKGIMRAIEVFGVGDLIPDKYGIPSAVGEEISPHDIDFAIVPAVAFEKSGKRLGRGGGYYDRFLEKLDAFTVGICHPCQILNEIETEKHDIPVNLVISGE